MKRDLLRVMLFAAVAVAACAQTPAAPGSLVSIYGTELAAALAQADTITLSPSINAGGVVNGASFQPGIVPGSWLTIQGTNLSLP